MTNPKLHWKNTKGLCGLTSLGNTHFINCVLQAWSNIPSIKKIMKKINRGFILMGMSKSYPTKSHSIKYRRQKKYF